MSDEEITRLIIESGAITIREEPFIYSSGNRGPGYVMIKGLVSRYDILSKLVCWLLEKLPTYEVINGNATGGMIWGYEIARLMNAQFIYMRNMRKVGGHNEMAVGMDHIPKNSDILVVEELVNYGETTINAVKNFRDMGYTCNTAACILSYGIADKKLTENGIKLISLITLPRLLEVAREYNLIDSKLIDSYEEYLKDPILWQIRRGYPLPKESALEAEKRGYMIEDMKDGYYKVTQKKPFVWVALDDCPMELFHKLLIFEGNFGLKYNLDNLLQNWYFPKNKQIFLDLKMWNGLETMKRVISKINGINSNIRIVNVYAHAGVEYLSCLVKEFPSIQIYAVTVLTHYDEEYCMKMYNRSLHGTVMHLVEIAKESGCAGVIVPPQYASLIKGIKVMCPGVRINGHLDGDDKDRQKQIGSLEDVVNADDIVVGREVIKDKDPIGKLKEVLNKLNL